MIRLLSCAGDDQTGLSQDRLGPDRTGRLLELGTRNQIPEELQLEKLGTGRSSTGLTVVKFRRPEFSILPIKSPRPDVHDGRGFTLSFSIFEQFLMICFAFVLTPNQTHSGALAH